MPFTTVEPQPMRRKSRPGWLARLLTDSAYTLMGLPSAIVIFTVLVVGWTLGVGTAITIFGLPILTGTLYVARFFAESERRALARVVDVPAVTIRYARAEPSATWWRRVLTPLGDSRYWLDFGHGILSLFTSLVSFSLVLTWWLATVSGLLYPLWFWALPDGNDDQRLHELIGLPDTAAYELGFYGLTGVVFAVTLPMIVRVSTLLRAVPAREILFHVSQLQQQISGLEQQTAAAHARAQTAQEQKAAAVSAEAQALRRLERDIHDGPQQRLVRLAMDLGRAQHQLGHDPEAARATVAEALSQTRETLDELRALSRGIAPPILADRGLTAAVAALAGRSTVPVELDTNELSGRLDPAMENAAYFVIAESLTNVAKHSRATECTVTLRRDATQMTVEIRDNGVGGAALAKGHGLSGLSDRVHAIGGALSVQSPEGGPTVVVAFLPLGPTTESR